MNSVQISSPESVLQLFQARHALSAMRRPPSAVWGLLGLSRFQLQLLHMMLQLLHLRLQLLHRFCQPAQKKESL